MALTAEKIAALPRTDRVTLYWPKTWTNAAELGSHVDELRNIMARLGTNVNLLVDDAEDGFTVEVWA